MTKGYNLGDCQKVHRNGFIIIDIRAQYHAGSRRPNSSANHDGGITLAKPSTGAANLAGDLSKFVTLVLSINTEY